MPINADVIKTDQTDLKIGNIIFIFQMDPISEIDIQVAFTQKCARDLPCGLH